MVRSWQTDIPRYIRRVRSIQRRESDFTGKILNFLSEENYKRHEISASASYTSKWSDNNKISMTGLLLLDWLIEWLATLAAAVILVSVTLVKAPYWPLSWLLMVIIRYADEVRWDTTLNRDKTEETYIHVCMYSLIYACRCVHVTHTSKESC